MTRVALFTEGQFENTILLEDDEVKGFERGFRLGGMLCSGDLCACTLEQLKMGEGPDNTVAVEIARQRLENNQ